MKSNKGFTEVLECDKISVMMDEILELKGWSGKNAKSTKDSQPLMFCQCIWCSMPPFDQSCPMQDGPQELVGESDVDDEEDNTLPPRVKKVIRLCLSAGAKASCLKSLTEAQTDVLSDFGTAAEEHIQSNVKLYDISLSDDSLRQFTATKT